MTEELSRLMDSELSVAEQRRLLSALFDKANKNGDIGNKAGENLATWERYHLAANVLQAQVGTEQMLVPSAVAGKIRHAVADEPTCLAPAAARDVEKAMHKSARKSAATSGLAGLAMAATLAAVAVIGYNAQWFTTPGVDQTGGNQSVVAERSTRWNINQPEHESDLNSLLVEHGEFMPPSGLNGLMAYAKFVAYDSQ